MKSQVDIALKTGLSDIYASKQAQPEIKDEDKTQDTETAFIELLAQLLSGGNAQAIISEATKLNLASKKDSPVKEEVEQKMIEDKKGPETYNREKPTAESRQVVNKGKIKTSSDKSDPKENLAVKDSQNQQQETEGTIVQTKQPEQQSKTQNTTQVTEQDKVSAPQMIKQQKAVETDQLAQAQDNFQAVTENSNVQDSEVNHQESPSQKSNRNFKDRALDYKVEDNETSMLTQSNSQIEQPINQQVAADVKKVPIADLNTFVRPSLGAIMPNSAGTESNLVRMPTVVNEGFSKVDLGVLYSNAGKEKQATPGGDSKPTTKLSPGLQAQIIERIQQLLEQSAKSSNGNSMIVRLDPPNLGQMTVKVIHRGDQLFAKIMADSPDVETVLRSRIPEIVKVLSTNGIKADNVTVSIGKDMGQNYSGSNPEQGLNGQKDFRNHMFSARHHVGSSLPLTNSLDSNLQTVIDQGWIA